MPRLVPLASENHLYNINPFHHSIHSNNDLRSIVNRFLQLAGTPDAHNVYYVKLSVAEM